MLAWVPITSMKSIGPWTSSGNWSAGTMRSVKLISQYSQVGSEHRTSKSKPWMDSVCGRAGAKEGEDAGREFQVLGGGDEFIEVEADRGIES